MWRRTVRQSVWRLRRLDLALLQTIWLLVEHRSVGLVSVPHAPWGGVCRLQTRVSTFMARIGCWNRGADGGALWELLSHN